MEYNRTQFLTNCRDTEGTDGDPDDAKDDDTSNSSDGDDFGSFFVSQGQQLRKQSTC
jgi:hypothetical protein